MENRRPPRSNSSGPGKYYDRSRSRALNHLSGPLRNDSESRGNVGNNDVRTFGPPRGRDNGFDTRQPNRNPRFGRGTGTGSSKFDPQRGPERTKKQVRSESDIKITSDLQITDGKFKGKLLVNSVSPKCLPTPRALRETMFRMLFRRIRGGRFLDLCAGCGTMGLEALSRGSMLSTFVENSARRCSFLRTNIIDLAIKDGHGEVVEMETVPYLNRAAKKKRRWDVVFLGRVDGPAATELIEMLGRGTVIEPGGVAVIEHPAELVLPMYIGSLSQWRTMNKNGTALSFYSRRN